MIPWWRELSNSELKARLVQRDVPEFVAAEWVHWRESTFRDEITRLLGEE